MLKQGHVVSSAGNKLSFNHEFLPLVVKLHPRASFVQLDGRVDMKGHPKSSKLLWRRSALDNFEELGITLSNNTHGYYKFIDGYALGNVTAASNQTSGLHADNVSLSELANVSRSELAALRAEART